MLIVYAYCSLVCLNGFVVGLTWRICVRDLFVDKSYIFQDQMVTYGVDQSNVLLDDPHEAASVVVPPERLANSLLRFSRKEFQKSAEWISGMHRPGYLLSPYLHERALRWNVCVPSSQLRFESKARCCHYLLC